MTEMTETGAHADGGDPGSPPYPDASEEFMNPDLLRAEVEVMSYPDLLARARTFGEAAKVSTALLFVAKAVGRDLATIDLTRFKKAGEEALAGLDERQMELVTQWFSLWFAREVMAIRARLARGEGEASGEGEDALEQLRACLSEGLQ